MIQDDAVSRQRWFGFRFLNLTLHATHIFVIGFSVTGWIFPATRLANLVLILMILASWYVLGPLLGKPSAYGYCLITDLQWRLRRRLGFDVPSWGYMKFLIDAITKRQVDEGLIDRMTALALFMSLFATIVTIWAF